MNITDSERRRNDILQAIVETYISSASPVGSAFISRKIRETLSPATIRNIMAELEEQGLLEQPHTSAGRVPTDQGWRVYVNQLMHDARLSPQEARRLHDLVQPEELEVAQVFERASQVLAELSRQGTFVVAPTVRHSRVKQIELLPVGLHQLVCVLVAQEAMIASHLIELEEPLSQDDARSLADFLNAELRGLPAEELLASLERRMEAIDESLAELVKRSLGILQSTLATEPEERFFFEGTVYLFEQPEFRREPEKAHGLLRCLESAQAFLARVRGDISGEGVQVRIGREVGVGGLEDCSYILAPFGLRRGAVGGIGILGPKRMDYRRMRALAEAMASLVTETLTRRESA